MTASTRSSCSLSAWSRAAARSRSEIQPLSSRMAAKPASPSGSGPFRVLACCGNTVLLRPRTVLERRGPIRYSKECAPATDDLVEENSVFGPKCARRCATTARPVCGVGTPSDRAKDADRDVLEDLADQDPGLAG